MALQRMDHIGDIVDDLRAAIGFFVEPGLDLDGDAGAGLKSSAPEPCGFMLRLHKIEDDVLRERFKRAHDHVHQSWNHRITWPHA
jgi:catechol 2,3-dioxygenase-like lactoylglutathione lyase family enzyme